MTNILGISAYYHASAALVVDGYPFEVAKPEQILARLHPKGFVLLQMTTCAGGHGCNEFLFQRTANEQSQDEGT